MTWVETILPLLFFAIAMAGCCCGNLCVPVCESYPCLVTITIPALGISELALNTEDPDCVGSPTAGWPSYTYNLEGDFNGYTCQCVFQECGWAVVIAEVEGDYCCYGTSNLATDVQVDYVSCDPLLIIHTIPCDSCGSGTLEIIIEEVV